MNLISDYAKASNLTIYFLLAESHSTKKFLILKVKSLRYDNLKILQKNFAAFCISNILWSKF